MKIELDQEEIDRLIKAVETDMNFCKRTLRHDGILPNYRERLKKRVEEYDKLLEKLVQPDKKNTTSIYICSRCKTEKIVLDDEILSSIYPCHTCNRYCEFIPVTP